MPTSSFVRFASVALITAPLLAACGNSQRSTQAAPPPPQVTVGRPETRTIVDQDEYVGRFVAIDAVEVRARISGYLAQVHFQDGQMVKTGDLLFTIDRRPFEIALEQARANLGQAKANLAFTESDLARGQQLLRDRTIAEQIYDQRVQAKKVAEASVAANEAIVRSAELDFNEFSELRAPVSGRIGDRRVSPGNLVTGGASGNTTLLATIVSMDPIRFEFTFDEAAYLRYQRTAKASGQDIAAMQVRVKLLDETDFAHEGRMDFVDNAISQTTGTIRGRAVFPNPDSLFTPGMFGRIQIPASAPYQALLVPDTAILTEQNRKYVLVTDAENTVRQKYVTLGQLSGSLRVIKDGLAADDRVIVNGLMRARPGLKVTPQDASSGPTSAKSAPGPTAKTD